MLGKVQTGLQTHQEFDLAEKMYKIARSKETRKKWLPRTKRSIGTPSTPRRSHTSLFGTHFPPRISNHQVIETWEWQPESSPGLDNIFRSHLTHILYTMLIVLTYWGNIRNNILFFSSSCNLRGIPDTIFVCSSRLNRLHIMAYGKTKTMI